MHNFKGIFYAVVSSATFGLVPLFSIPLLQAGMASPAILFYRMLIAALMTGAVVLFTRRTLRISGRDAAVLALLENLQRQDLNLFDDCLLYTSPSPRD